MTKHAKGQTVSSPRPAYAKASAGKPPVVAVLGHVDHGKTTLLDAIRKTNVAGGEHGGITQHIGAYQITFKNRLITFIDTPGHEAFAKMRSRGAGIADIAILVVSADDSVQPQTIESIGQINAAGIPMIVAVNKIDLPSANISKVKQDLAKAGVQLEGFGGDVPAALVSAKQGKGIPELLDLILLVGDMKGLPSELRGNLEVGVIETKVDKGRGMVATVLVKKGMLSIGSTLYEGTIQVCKVRAMISDTGSRLTAVTPGTPAEVLGFSKLPEVGAILGSVPVQVQKIAPEQVKEQKDMVADFLSSMEEAEKKKLKIILKADTAGSLEAIMEALPKDQVIVVQKGLGDITEADILDAKASQALIIGFNVKASSSIEMLARTEKVVFRVYTIIYELLKEIGDVVSGLEEVLSPERELGKGQIIAEFPYEHTRIAGTKILSGRLARGDTAKIMRGETEIARAKIKSMRRGKEEVNKVEAGTECGILFDRKVDFSVSDAIIAVTNV